MHHLGPQQSVFWNLAKTEPPVCWTHLWSERQLVHTDLEKAAAYANSHEMKFRSKDIHSYTENISHAANGIRSRQEIPENKFSTSEEVRKDIQRTRTRKAPGRDKISNRTSKRFTRKAVVALTGIINAMLILSYFPKKLKEADAIMLMKMGTDRLFLQNYRSISLISNLFIGNVDNFYHFYQI